MAAREGKSDVRTREGPSSSFQMDPAILARLEELDPDVDLLVGAEADRQNRKIILIPSESITPWPVRQVIGSVFVSLYAEGYPPERMIEEDEEGLQDLGRHLAYYRRYGDRRFYKGTEFVHFVEALAQRRCAECFANSRKGAHEVFVNVQALSGSAANLAVYEAFLKPGETILAMDLMHGGHLSHGSHLHLSGKSYRVASYGVDPKTGRLDYNQVEDLARKHGPALIVAGYTSYPWAPDWEAFRAIADQCGARLMADVAHPAGLIAAGAYPSPVGYADVVTFTTHKTLCGPRGACILTFDAADAARVDSSVFPGLQGGPHVANIAAMAVSFRIARTESFARLQRRIVENAGHLAESLTREGVRLGYGGTNTHLLLLDLGRTRPGGEAPLRGEPASRILDLAGLVVNKNTLPGDASTALASGIRVGTPWVTQRGFGRNEMERIAAWLARLIKAIVPFRYTGRTGELPRGKIPLRVLSEVQREIDALMDSVPPCRLEGPGRGKNAGIEVGCRVRAEALANVPAGEDSSRSLPEDRAEWGDLDLYVLSHFRFLRVRGERAAPLMQQVTTRDAAGLSPGQCQECFVLDEEGFLADDILVLREAASSKGESRFLLAGHQECSRWLVSWLAGLSDGYLLFDREEPYRKVEGPVTLELDPAPLESGGLMLVFRGSQAGFARLPRLGELAGDLPRGSFQRVGEEEGMGVLCRLDGNLLVWIGPQGEGERLASELGSLGLRGKGRGEWEESRQQDGLPDYRRLPSGESGDRSGRPHARDLLAAGHAPRFVRDIPYFVGQSRLGEFQPAIALPEFSWPAGEGDAGHGPRKGRPTPLHPWHRARRARFISFAGWEMPGWYTQVTDEHRAVRKAAGLFDTTHMGVLEVRGPNAEEFLDLVGTNYARWYPEGMSYYGYLLDIHGEVIDDVLVYRRARDCFMVVVNAANHHKVLSWLEAVNRAEVTIDRDRRYLKRLRPVEIRDLSDPGASGDDARVDIALQGPASKEILKKLLPGQKERDSLLALKKGGFFDTLLLGAGARIARTGYTGEQTGYEIFAHPGKAGEIWERLVEIGEPAGLQPAGLAARDSLRVEAGLPLYGQELAGPERLQPGGAGFGAYVKFHKPFFIGRSPSLEAERARRMELCRFRMSERGIRVPRPGDPVVNRRGKVIGKVTSCATGTDGHLLGLAYVERGQALPGSFLGVLPVPDRSGGENPHKAELQVGDKVPLAEEARVLERFPTSEERKGWR